MNLLDVGRRLGKGKCHAIDFGNRSLIVGGASQRHLLRRCCGSTALVTINGVSMVISMMNSARDMRRG